MDAASGSDQLQSYAEGAPMGKLEGLVSIVSELRAERTNLVNQLKHVDAALSVLGKVNGSGTSRGASQPTRIVSAASRRKMALAQRARWAKVQKKSQPVMLAAKTMGLVAAKSTMSASTRRKIAAAQRARWANFRAQQKKKAA
jgi:DNA-binding PucR family transcriptional regulator